MSIPKLRHVLAGAVLALVLPAGAMAQRAPAPTVDELVKAMTGTLAGASSITFHVEKMFDDVLVTGEKIHYAGAIDVAMRRPDRFHVSYGDDLSAKEAWYDGEQFILHDLLAGVYGRLPAAATIDATFDAMAEKYDVRMPLAGLMSSDAYEVFTAKATEQRYIGLHDVDGVAAHHIFFSDETVDWQLWIDAGEAPLPLKLVVTHAGEPGEPQSIFLFTEWDLAADLPDDAFTPQIPEEAALAAFLPR